MAHPPPERLADHPLVARTVARLADENRRLWHVVNNLGAVLKLSADALQPHDPALAAEMATAYDHQLAAESLTPPTPRNVRAK